MTLAQPARFESATIKISKVQPLRADPRQAIRTGADSLDVFSAPLKDCIAWAYQVQPFQIAQSERLPADFFEISAKAGRAVSTDELRAMLETLLVERFHLAVHREKKSMTIYALTAGRHVYVKHVDGDGAMTVRAAPPAVIFESASMFDLASLLTERFGTPVIDETSLKGRFHLRLDASRYLGGDPPEVDEIRGDAAALYMAVQDELGLMLDHRKAEVEMLAIDHAERPLIQ